MFQYLKTWASTITTILWLIVLTKVASAQTPTLTPTYAFKKGLPSSTVNHITEDNQQHIWIATENGIKTINNPQGQWLEERLYGKSILQLGFLKDQVFVGCRDSFLIINQLTKKLITSFTTVTIGVPRKIKIIENEIWIVTSKQVFRCKDASLKPVYCNSNDGSIFDLTYYNGAIVAATYPNGKIEILTDNKFKVDEKLTSLINPIKAPLLTIAAKNDTLVVGGDGFYGVVADNKRIDQNQYKLRNNVVSNYAVWDIAFTNSNIYFGIGDTHNLISGGIISAFPLFNNLPQGSPYIQTLYYQKSNGSLWMGSLYDGVFKLHRFDETITNNGLKYEPGFQKSDYYLYDGLAAYEITNKHKKKIPLQDIRIIKTIRDTTFILSFINLTVVPKNGKRFTTQYNPHIGMLYTHTARLGDSLYAFALYKPTTIINLNTFEKSTVDNNKIITAVEKQNNYILCHNQGKGFTLFTASGYKTIKIKNQPSSDIQDFTTTPNNEIIILSENKLQYYVLEKHLNSVRFIKAFDFEKSFLDFTPKWIINGTNGLLYVVSDQGIVSMKQGEPVYFTPLSDAKITGKPFVDAFNRLIVQYEKSTRLIGLQKITSNVSALSVEIPTQVFQANKIDVNIKSDNDESNISSLIKILIFKDNKVIYKKYNLSSSTQIDTLLPKGLYQVQIFLNNKLQYNKPLIIEIPWHQNPWYRLFLLLMISLAVYLFFRNRHNQKVYAKKLISNKLEMIQQNLNPHFVFNSLNLIYSSILEDKKEEALKTVRDFSKIHRSFLERAKEKKVSIASELAFIESYIAMEVMRFKENIPISHNITIDPTLNISTIFIPPNILQPLVENAIKYGILGYRGAEVPNIFIDVCKTDNQVIISIENPLGESTELYKGTGMGQSIVQERIQLFNLENKTNIQFQTSQKSKHFKTGYCVTICINP